MRLPPLALAFVSCLASPSCQSNKSETDSTSSAEAPQNGLIFTGRRPDGREIALSNRTKWSIQPAGASATLRWQGGEPVQLGASGEALWPTSITSRKTGATAFARPAGTF